MSLIQKVESELSTDEILQIQQLVKATWPDPTQSNPTNRDLILAFKERIVGRTAHLLVSNDELMGYAETFVRAIFTEQSQISVLGLGTVCVSETHRGKGLGAQIVSAIFEQLPQEKAEVCLFQTGVPGFYEKLNCKKINNRFVNAKNIQSPEENPFWDNYTMIYPASYTWPKGTIDLNGKGF